MVYLRLIGGKKRPIQARTANGEVGKDVVRVRVHNEYLVL
jgi:hypothetical protein